MKKIGKLLKSKKWKWTAGGVMCLVVAAMIFALSADFGSEAVMLNGTKMTLTETNGVYEIDVYSELKALGDASADETKGKTFQLVKDITINSLTAPATGTFAGTFDGNGHVIIIESVSELSNSNAGSVSEGLLFGSVVKPADEEGGSIKNLIVDIKTDVKYTRTSTVGVGTNGTDEVSVVEEAVAPYSGVENFSTFSSDDAAKKLADDFNSSEFADSNIISYGEKTYYRVSGTEQIKKTTTYELNDPVTDHFGIICGSLDSGAKIEKVYVKGPGVLNIIQNAGKVSNVKEASGTREKYFYYEKNTGSYVEEVQSAGASVNAETVTFYDKNAEVDDKSTDNNGVKITVSAPKYVEKNGNIVYTVDVVNSGTTEIELSNLSAVKEGIEEGIETVVGTPLSLNTKLDAGASGSYNYTVSGVETDLNVNIKLEYKYTIGSGEHGPEAGEEGEDNQETVENQTTTETITVTLMTEKGLYTTVVDTSSAQASDPTDVGLKLTLTPEKINYIADDSVNVTYTLTIENNVTEPENAASRTLKIKKEDIALNIDNASQTIAWTQNGQNFSEATIGGNGKITLKGVLTLEHTSDVTRHNASVMVTPSVQENTYTNVATYRYVEVVPNSLAQYSTANYEDLVDGPANTTKGNHLNAGIVAGTSKGSITNTKQNMLINGSSYDGNTAELNIGGIIGRAESGATASSLYILGTQNYAGKNSSLPTGSIVADGTKPNDTDWSSYCKYESTGEISENFDLAWLVKEDSVQSPYFTYSEPTDRVINVIIPSDKGITENELKYTVAYNARPSLDVRSEEEIYVDEKITLGNSGYYRLLNTYATDGYYHYTTPVSTIDNAEICYPHGKPYKEIYAVSDRAINPLNDKIVIAFECPDNSGEETPVLLNGSIRYEINSTVVPNSESEKTDILDPKDTGIPEGLHNLTFDNTCGIAQIPFEIVDSYYKITPVIGDLIYPTKTTNTFNNREPLPAPVVKCFDYYDKDGKKNPYIDLAKNGSYEAGTDMQIIPHGDEAYMADYTFRYKFSTTQLNGNDRIINAIEYSGSATIPDTLTGDQVYLYVEASKKAYDSVIYEYGPFSVKTKVKIADYLNGTPVGEKDENHRVLNDDVVTLKIDPDNTPNSGIQYMVSTVPTISYSWTDYDSTEGIKLSENTGGYIYVRIKYDEKGERFSAPQLFDFTFGSACASPIITPNTGLSTSGEGSAAIIDSTTLIGLSSRTEGAEVFYVASNADNTDRSMSIEMERALTEPNDKQDGIIEDGYKYFMIGERWYRTGNTNVQKYTSGLSLSHSEEEAKYMYITAVAVADDYKISDELTFIYKVKPPQQVKAPEATFETRFTPGGENVETATVSKDGKLSFYSITPGAVLYYALGTIGDNWIEIPEDGVPVDGDFGGNFVVRVRAKKFAENSEEEIMLPSEVITFVYRIAEQEQANAPTAIPATSADVPTTVIPGNKILLSTTTKGADIFYTTDGTTPQVELAEVENEDGTKTNKYQKAEGSSTEEYNSEKGIEMPLDGKDYFTITAIAVKDGLGTSPEARFTYVYPDTVLAPYANIDSGKVELNTKVLLKNLTEGAVIYYNAAYGADIKEEKVEEPTLSSTVFNEQYPFTITQKTIVKAMAAKDGVKSSVVTFIFDPMAQLAVPTASIETGSVVSNGTVLQLSAEKGATIYYTIDGSDPADSANPAVMSGNNVTLNGEPGGQITIKAIAKAVDNSQSEIVTFTYQFSQNAMGGVTANIATGSTISNGTKVILMSDVSEAEIYYTTDGESPVEHGKKGTTVEINGTPGTLFTIKAVAKVNGEAGIVSTFIYKIKEKPEEPTASPAGGTLTAAVRVSLDSGAEKIYYTTDGTEPTKSSDLYNEPILINRTTTLKAIAVSEDGEVSDVATFQYTAAPKAAMPKSDLETGQMVEPGTKVKLWSDTPNTTIYYSTDGTDPTVNNLESLLIYDSEGIEINRSVTIKAVAQIEGMRLSNVSTWDYIVDVIPAVEMKKEEAAKLAEEGLKDTDASELNRKNDKDASDKQKRVLKEKKHNTMLISAKENIADNAVLYAEEKEINRMAVRNAQTLFGDDYTILSEYEIRLKSGKSYVQPNGEVEVVIPIPKGYENATLTVVTVDSKDKLTTLETRRKNGMLYASTSSLREFAVVGLESPEEFSRTFPYLLLLEITAGAVLVFGVVYYGMEKYKKYKKRK